MKVEVRSAVVDRDAAWTAIGDTDWLNRVLGNGKVLALDVSPDDTGYPKVTGALEGVLGTRLPFEEDDNRWVAGRYFRQGRAYDHPLLRRSTYEARLEPDGDGVIAVASMELLHGSLVAPIVATALRRIKGRLQRHLDDLPPPGGAPPRPLRELPAATLEAWSRWKDGVSPELADRLLAHFQCARPLELQRMRPYRLADAWGLDRQAVLEGLVHGIRDGLVELYWSVRCPRCYGQTKGTGHLGDLADHASCASCRVGFGVDLGEHVEVLFAPHPSIGSRVVETFCSLFPFGAPETQASFLLGADEVVQERLELEPGAWRLGMGGDTEDLGVEVVAGAEATSIRWSPTVAGAVRVRPGPVDLQVTNGPTRARIQLVRLGQERADRVLASRLATMPQFRRSLNHQVLSPDVRIATRSVALLFTDLTGSTAMYEELGDATAFAVVRDHFALLRRIVEAHGGVVVKTIGDAVMAAFDAPTHAISAGIDMSNQLDTWTGTLGIGARPRLRVGVHVGPALMVHSDASGLDYFGRTVNIAARAQGVAMDGEVVWTEAVHRWTLVQTWLADRGVEAEPLSATLKGLGGAARLYRLRAADAADV